MNKITCICLGVRNMERSMKFYRDGLGFKTDCREDNPPVCFFDTPGTKFELYPLDLLAKDIGGDGPLPTGNGFCGITLAYNVAEKKDVDKTIELVENAGGTVVRNRRMSSGAVITHIFPTPTAIVGKWHGGRIFNSTRTVC